MSVFEFTVHSLQFNAHDLKKRTCDIFTNKKTRSVCLSVCLSGYTFRHALLSHADILDNDRGHIFRKYRHENNKKVAVI